MKKLCSLITTTLLCLPIISIAAESHIKGVPQDSTVKTVIDNQVQPPVNYANIWVDKEGETHIAKCRIEGLDFKSYAPPAEPQWIGISPDQIDSIAWAALPVGYVGQWHSAPGPQWVVTLAGQWEVETSDGDKIIQGPGEIQFNADTGAKGKNGKNGHVSRTVGNEPNIQLIVKLKKGAKNPSSAQECRY